MNYFLAISIPFFILLISGNWMIKFLKKINFGQQVRKEGPESHFEKEGIPTMGGVLILSGILISSVFLKINKNLLIALITTFGMGLVGFLDDYLKIKKERSLGLTALAKIIGQFGFAIIISLYVYFTPEISNSLIIPFTSNSFEIGIFIIPLIVFTVVGTANAVNLTDGLDGLASSVTAVVAASYTFITSALYFDQLSLFSLIIVGACLGFIWYNSHPAEVFMGDVGSLGLGGAIASLAVLTRTELLLLIIGGVYVIETVSVILQVLYFKATKGKRIFRMTPIHHHFELKGWDEPKVVFRFLLIQIIFSIIGLYSFL
ncbi:MAG: phospho-N-acetylmuramoyl-pentapeptide-transferase [Bacillota bacterium]